MDVLKKIGVVMTSNSGRPGVRFITENGWAYCKRGGMECSDPALLRRRPADDEVQLDHSSNHMENFLASAREGKDPICPVEVGHRSNTICVLHDVSMKLNGRKLNWDPVLSKSSSGILPLRAGNKRLEARFYFR